ncbi:MAG: 5-carboxymethyl-2-hydroxymuconate isomerase [Verrucomicrobiales bacterium]|nr:5-carboxymethyl-2-hydroxymuconate isomerase [Verrucomicrobiales bacterium]
MKIIRYQDSSGLVRYGAQQEDGSAKVIEGCVFGEHKVTDETAKVEKLLAPITPSQILCIGLNYKFHAKECNVAEPENPILFTKGVNTLNNPGDPIEVPRALRSDEVDYEVELAVVIGKDCKNATNENALDYVLGYTAANDVSARDWQIKWNGGQWCRGKTFDTFSPLGPCLVTGDEIGDAQNLKLSCTVNGKVMQDWNTNDMIFPIVDLIVFLSGSTTLPKGTVILTGTPHGVGLAQDPPLFLKEGDEVKVEIENIGSFSNPVVDEKV